MEAKRPKTLKGSHKKGAHQNSKLLNSCTSSGDSESPVEAKRSREKADDVDEKEQMNQEATPFFKTIMEAIGKNSGEVECDKVTI